MRSKHGEATTAFERVTDGSRTAAAGDVVRINAKPQLVGRVLFFTIPQVGCAVVVCCRWACAKWQHGMQAGQHCNVCVLPTQRPSMHARSAAPYLQATKEEGAYANGRVHVELLPAEVYGAGCEKQFSLRRLEGVLTEAEQQEHVQREMLKVGARLLSRSAVCDVAAVPTARGFKRGRGGWVCGSRFWCHWCTFHMRSGWLLHPSAAGAQLAAHRAHALHHGADARVLCGCAA